MSNIFRRLFSAAAASSDSSARSLIEQVINDNAVVVFMKGSATKPMCGYSKAVCQVLNLHHVEKYTTVNVLEDEAVRREIKAFTNWPTIPQVFVKGQFVGGCDIIMEMNKSGELEQLLQKEGIVCVKDKK
jgi:monothiol glutaredoxin